MSTNIISFILTRYKDESDYALKFMESSWKDLQKEEARRYDEQNCIVLNVAQTCSNSYNP